MKRGRNTFDSFFTVFNACDTPPHVKDPPSALPFFPFFLSLCLYVSFLCTLSLSLPPTPLPPTCTLWYADMQEFLGLKMIDLTCQPWLLLLKMAALAVCMPVIGARLE